ncbi:N-acetyltransferase [Streptomyces sp. NBC_01754]|uniref:N-acetyltransferase n=1 Tax=Streptomyces sp. NBC_01754 TaxID=2975930 RepID=UPI002DDA68C7|nr:N-acetyltransferase [Streptomyces sp. NBC_01754]WSC95138.1 N-acetyltransferase [Streptomyces sp. NBC_01754]
MRVVTVDDVSLVRAIHRDVFTPAFTPDELTGADELWTAVQQGGGVLTAVMDEEDRPAAAAFGEWYPESRVLLLVYLAVGRTVRSRGLGGVLLAEAVGAWQTRFRPALTLAELEHPVVHPGDPARGDGRSRLRFYARHGARALDLPYFQPSLRPGGRRVYGMVLTVLEPLPERAADGGVEPGRIRRFLTAYLTGCEGEVGSDAPTLALWRALDRPGAVRLLPLDDPAALPVSHAGGPDSGTSPST